MIKRIEEIIKEIIENNPYFNSFDTGLDFEKPGNNRNYPLFFLEQPYNYSLNMTEDQGLIEFGLNFMILDKIDPDNPTGDDKIIYDTSTSLEYILRSLNQKDLQIISPSSVITINNILDDGVSGIRVEVTISTTINALRNENDF